MIEKLLKFLIAKVDAKLLETVIIKDFKSSNIENADESDSEKKKIK